MSLVQLGSRCMNDPEDIHVVEGYGKRESKGSISPDPGAISTLLFYGSADKN